MAGSVGEDALLTGGQVELAAGGTIGEDLIVTGGQVTVAGDVTGSVTGAAGTYSRTGQVGGSDDVQIRQTQSPFDRTPDLVGDAIRHFLSVVLVGLIALWLAPRFMAVAEGSIRRRPLAAAGWGLGGFLGFFVLLIVIPLITVLVALVLACSGSLGSSASRSSPASWPCSASCSPSAWRASSSAMRSLDSHSRSSLRPTATAPPTESRC